MLNDMFHPNELSRRNFIKLAGIGVTGIIINPKTNFNDLAEFPAYERLGRVCVGGMVNIKSQPYVDSQNVGVLYEDTVVPWLRELSAKAPDTYNYNQRWVETPDGFIYAPYLQPVKNFPNIPIDTLMKTSTGEGMWAEVTIPFADAALVYGPSSNSWVHYRIDHGLPLRVYYGQVYYIDQIKVDDLGNKYYRANPNYYGGVDLLWVPAESMRPISSEELTPINPLAEEQKDRCGCK